MAMFFLAGCVGSSSEAKSSYESGIRITQTPWPDVDGDFVLEALLSGWINKQNRRVPGEKRPPAITTENYTLQTFEGKAVNERGAITPPVVNVPGIESSETTTKRDPGGVIAGAMAAVNQLIKQLDYVIWLGCGLVAVGVVLLVLAFKFPLISHLMSMAVIATGFACFFVPTLIIKGWWIILICIGCGFIYAAWQNGWLVKRGAAAATGLKPAPPGISQASINKAAGSGITDMTIMPPDGL